MNVVTSFGSFASTAGAAASSALESGGVALDAIARASDAQRRVLLAEPAPAAAVAPSLGRALLVTRPDGSRYLLASNGRTIPVGVVVAAGALLLLWLMGGR